MILADARSHLTVGGLAALACSLEVSAPKPGNVHRRADFHDMTFDDFILSGILLGNIVDQEIDHSVGHTILSVIKATRKLVGVNTNLGIALLIVPLAKAIQWYGEGRPDSLTPETLGAILTNLSREDARLVFESIRHAKPGGLGQVAEADLNQPMPVDLTLVQAMSLAAERDLIARQYTNRFEEVFGIGVDSIRAGRARYASLSEAIVFAQLQLMASCPDSLIARKCGDSAAKIASDMARRSLASLTLAAPPDGSSTSQDVLSSGSLEELDFTKLNELDGWLRAEGNKRNPGTTADLLAASLFVALAKGEIGL